MTLQHLKELIDMKLAENPENANLEIYEDEVFAGAKSFSTRLETCYLKGNVIYVNSDASGFKTEFAKNPEHYKKGILL